MIPLAILGASCRLPGADGLDEYWNLIASGRSAIGPLPAKRLDLSLYYSPERGLTGKTYSRIGAVVNYPQFAAAALGLEPELAAAADPSHLAFCQVAIEACRHAGYDPFHLPNRHVGVFVGHTRGSRRDGDFVYDTCVDQTAAYLRALPEFTRLAGSSADEFLVELAAAARRRIGAVDRRGAPHLASHMAAALVARALKLNGPPIVLNAACASSLYGFAVAARAFEHGRIDAAIVGGASYLKPDTLVLFSQAQSVSAVGSRPFDAAADGLTVGEGYAAVFIKTLRRALEDGDRILAVIRAIGTAADGRGKSLWAPRKEGQMAAMRRAYGDELDPRRLGYIEAHATSTPRGDATEMSALAAALAPRLAPGARLPIGSVKANIGHTLEAAGMASLAKVLLALQHATIPRQINCPTPSPSIPWRDLPFYLPPANEPWPAPPDDQPRLAAINAFGIGGLNAHVVIEEYAPGAPHNRRHIPRVAPARSSQHTPSAARLAAGGSPAHAPSLPPVAVVGAACLFPGARTLAALAGELASALVPPPPGRWAPADAVGGFLTGVAPDWKRHKLPPVQIARGNPLQFMILDTAAAALDDAGYAPARLPRERTGVIVGTSFGSDFSDQLHMAIRLPDFLAVLRHLLARRGIEASQADELAGAYVKTLLARLPALLDETGGFTTSTLASRLTKTFDLMGEAFTLDAGDASAAAAVAAAADLLTSGACDVVLCAAGQQRLGPPGYALLHSAERLAPAGQAGPPGCQPGEGVGVLVLKRLADARRDGDRIRALLDANLAHGATADEALRTALHHAHNRQTVGVRLPARVEIIPTGRVADDVVLAEAARCEVSRTSAIPVQHSASVRQCGHTLAASGMRAALAAIAAQDHHAPAKNLAVDICGFDPSGTAWHLAVTPDQPVPETPPSLLPAAARPLAAFVFAGNKAWRPNMLRALIGELPTAREAVAEIDLALAAIGLPSFADLAAAQEPSTAPAPDIALLAAEIVLARSLAALGLPPDRVTGRGIGLLAAAVVSGACPLDTAFRLAASAPIPGASLRCEPPRVPFLSSASGRYEAEPAEIARQLTSWRTTAQPWADVVRRLCCEPEIHRIEIGGNAANRDCAASQSSPSTYRIELACDRARLEQAIAQFRASSACTPHAPHSRNRSEAPERVCERFVMRLVQKALPLSATSAPSGTALVCGNQTASAALASEIARRGGRAVILPATDDETELLAAVDRASPSQPPAQLFLLAPFDNPQSLPLHEPAWTKLRRRDVWLPYLLCQRWFQRIAAAKLLNQAALVAAVDFGGDAGLAGASRHAAGGALAGLVKAVRAEVNQCGASGFRAKVVDTFGLAPKDRPSVLLAEAATADGELEVAYNGACRHVLRHVAEPLFPTALPPVTPGGTWIVTGGARGVTAIVARELAQRFGWRVHLIGSSPAPCVDPAWRDLPPEGLRALKAEVVRAALARGEVPAEAWSAVEKSLEIDANLRRFAEAGVTAVYHACNVSDRAGLARVLDEIRAAGEPIRGVIHGAGFERSARFESKPLTVIDRTIAAKVDGAAALIELTWNDPLECFLAFGSISGRLGAAGQTDYSLANEMLARLVGSLRQARPSCRAVTFHWHSWGEVGMAMRPETLHEKRRQGMTFMPPQEGVAHILAELSAGAPRSEVLITTRAHLERVYPQSLIPVTAAAAGPATAAAPKPLLASVGRTPPDRVVATIHLDPTADPFLREHQYKGRPILPAVMAVEAFVEAAAELAASTERVSALRNFELRSALRLFSDRQAVARVSALRTADGVECRLNADFVNRSGDVVERDRLHATGTLEFGAASPSPPPLPDDEPRDWSDVLYPGQTPTPDALGAGRVVDVRQRETLLAHGPPLRCLRQVSYDAQGGWCRISVPPFAPLAGNRPGVAWFTEPAVLDACLLACGVWLWVRREAVMGMPQRIGRLEFFSKPQPGDGCLLRFDCLRHEGGVRYFDLRLWSDLGRPVLHATDYGALVVHSGSKRA